MNEKEARKETEGNYTLFVYQAYNNNVAAIKAVAKIATSLVDIYRYFEPAFFTGEFYMCKSFDDSPCFPRKNAKDLYDKAILLHKTTGKLIVQVFNDDTILMWENEDPNILLNNPNVLTYLFKDNREYFLANDQTLEITEYTKGSRYAPQFVNLMKYLITYHVERIYQSSCAEFKKAWHDPNRLFFRSEGSGKNIPEDHMQESLYDYLRICLRGISMETSREFNVSTATAKPKPVDLKIQWKEANRTALIEIKWVGAVKNINTKKVRYNDTERAANPGYVQLKGYYDAALGDMPNTILKAHLVVIDGRRNNLGEDAVTISHVDGMYYKDKDLVIDEANKYYESNPGFEKPVRMFVAPITI